MVAAQRCFLRRFPAAKVHELVIRGSALDERFTVGIPALFDNAAVAFIARWLV
jgi:hypothetical protein